MGKSVGKPRPSVNRLVNTLQPTMGKSVGKPRPRMVMAGVDLETIRKLGGWTTLRMVQKYASVTAHHMRDSIRKLA